jgi:predicted deacylase
MDEDFCLTGEGFDRGTKSYRKLRVTSDLNGEDISLYVHVVRGKRPGAVLTLLCALHGSEWLPVEPLRRIVEQLNPNDMQGTLVVLPIANPVAYCILQRTTPDRSDSPDLNRSFPGSDRWIAEQLAQVITTQLLSQTDAMIDFHGGDWGVTLADVSYGIDSPNPAVVEQSKELAKAFGHPCIRRGKMRTVFPGPRSSVAYTASVLEKPAISVEVVGAGFSKEFEEQMITNSIVGIENVMKHLGMLEGAMVLPERYLVWEKRLRVYPTTAGHIFPTIEAQDLMLQEVKENQLLAVVKSPYTFETVDELRSPCDGVIFIACRHQPVRPGDFSFSVIDTTDAQSQWLRPDEF